MAFEVLFCRQLQLAHFLVLHHLNTVTCMQMYSLKEASTEYVAAVEETERKLSCCPVEVGIPDYIVA